MTTVGPVPEGAFHAWGGWYFRREPNGYVRVWRDPNVRTPGVTDVLLTDASWASILAAVSWRGENSETFTEAHQFHMGLDMIGDLSGGSDRVHAERVAAQITAALRYHTGKRQRNHLIAALRLLGVSDAT